MDQPAVASSPAKMLDESHLPPTKVKRKYVCKSCSFTTFNPREHLRHRRDVHGEKVRIVPCYQCQYACQFRQKLNRHLNLMHCKNSKQTPSEANQTSSSSIEVTLDSDNNQTIDLCQHQASSGTLEQHQSNLDHNYQAWLQFQHYIATSQSASSLYYQNPLTVDVNATEPLDLSMPKH